MGASYYTPDTGWLDAPPRETAGAGSPFSAAGLLSKHGADAYTPGGAYLGGYKSSADLNAAIQKYYGTSLSGFLRKSPTERSTAFNRTAGVKSIFDPLTGLPTRLPRTAEEAASFQFKAAEWARKKNEGMLTNAIASLRYGLGTTQRSSPFGTATMMSPLLGQMANTYMGMQYQQPDYSYFLRPDAAGGQGATPNWQVSSSRLMGLSSGLPSMAGRLDDWQLPAAPYVSPLHGPKEEESPLSRYFPDYSHPSYPTMASGVPMGIAQPETWEV